VPCGAWRVPTAQYLNADWKWLPGTSLVFLPRVEDFGDYVFNFEVGASASITTASPGRVWQWIAI
jgi:hypothetical protein